jgi:hypothetical protein
MAATVGAALPSDDENWLAEEGRMMGERKGGT